MSKLQHCVYVLLSQKDNKFYIGYTTNLRQRLTDHFHGDSKATAPRRPFILIYCEYFLSKIDAVNRERYLKTSTGKRMLKLLLKESLKKHFSTISKKKRSPVVEQNSLQEKTQKF